MSLRTPTEFVAALKAEGCRVAAHSGWTAVNRPGPWDPHGVVFHHTGPWTTVAGILDILRKGRGTPGTPDYLPGPLCHTGGRPDGIIDLVGWNDTNHAGWGARNVMAAVLGDHPTPAPSGPEDVDGNANFYGHEMLNFGDGKHPWPAAQVDAAVRYGAAICRLHGWKATSCIYHKTWTTRKVDPRWTISLLAFQAKISERLRHAPSWNPGAAPAPNPTPVPVPPLVPVPVPPPAPPVPDLANLAMALAKADDLSAYLARLVAGK